MLEIFPVYDVRVQNIAPLSGPADRGKRGQLPDRPAAPTNTHHFLPGNEVTPSLGAVGRWMCHLPHTSGEGPTSLRQKEQKSTDYSPLTG